MNRSETRAIGLLKTGFGILSKLDFDIDFPVSSHASWLSKANKRTSNATPEQLKADLEKYLHLIAQPRHEVKIASLNAQYRL